MQKLDILLRTAGVVLLGSLPFARSPLVAPLEAVVPGDDSAVAVPEEAAAEKTTAEPTAKAAPAVYRSTAQAEKREKRKRRPIEGALPIEWADEFTWRSIGPATMGGRCIDIAAHPTDPSCYWIATASGGLLKTTNNGVTYEHQFDSEDAVSIGSVAVSASNPDIVWVGTGEANPRNSVSWGDGVYKSLDGGATWEHMGLEGSFQVGAVVIHPTDPDTVYVGALGRLWGPNEERGFYKTTDGGETWKLVLYIDEYTGVIDARMHPEDPDTLLVATYVRQRDGFDTNDPWVKWGEGGAIYKTTDGGASFRKLTVGLPTVQLGRIGLDYCTSDPDIVYAVIESERISQEPENAAYAGFRGEDAEVGVRLTSITKDGPGEKAGLKEGDVLVTVDGVLLHTYAEMTSLIRKHVAGDTVHLVVARERKTVEVDLSFEGRPSEKEDQPKEDEEAAEEPAEEPAEEGAKTGPLEVEKPSFPPPGPFSGGLGGQRENVQHDQGPDGHEFGGVYRSADGGESWERINSVNPRPMYYSQIRVDPSDANYVYVLGTSLYRSSDGGVTFTSDGAGRDVHVDHHALWIDPADGRHIILGNDGGIYVSWDRMESWDHHNHVAIGQFYDVGTDARRDYNVYGGLQDNGSWGGPNRTGSREGAVNTDWIEIGGGDGFVCRVDANDPDLVYYESQDGGMGRTHLRTGEGGYMRPRGARGISYRFDWKTPFLLSNFNSKIFYSAGNYVFRSLDRGQGMRRISNEISRTDRGAASALVESPREEQELYVGTDDGALWGTRDGGVEWRDLFALNADFPVVVAQAAPSDPSEVTEVVESRYAPSMGQGAAIEPAGDAVTGDWKGRAAGEGIETDEEAAFTMSLRLGAEGKVTGLVQSSMGEGEISDGKFEPELGKLRISCTNDEFTVRFESTVKDGKMEGTVIGPAGSFRYTFTAKRVGEGAATPEEAVVELEVVAASGSAEPPVEGVVVEVVASAPAEKPKTTRRGRAKKDDGKDDGPKFLENTIDQLVPGRYRVSSLVASKHGDGRVFAAFDGHYYDDTAPYVYVSDDHGTSWKSIRGNLPDYAGSVRIVVEDPVKEDLLYLGTEFGFFVSIDRGASWTRFHGNLPTVAVHGIVPHVPSGDLVLGTHGRSIWITDITALRQMTAEGVREEAVLYDPNDVILWQRGQSRGSSGTRAFTGENPPSAVQIFYSLGKKARDIELTITNAAGDVIQTLEASPEKGLHRVSWDMRTSRTDDRGRRRGGRRASPGTYVAVLRVGEKVTKHDFEVRADPAAVDPRYLEFEEQNEEFEALRRAEEHPIIEFDDL